MYIAHFETEKREPKKIYFEASKRKLEKMEFFGAPKKSVKFIINKNMNLEVQ